MLNKLIYVYGKCKSFQMFFECADADFSDPVQRNRFHSHKQFFSLVLLSIAFIHTNNFSPLFFCPIFVLFWQTCMIFLSLLWLKTLFFTSLVVFGPIAMRHL